jgi:hypothetical protein
MARRATPRTEARSSCVGPHQAGVAHYECGDTSLARSVLEQAVDLSMAGPARARVLLDLGMGSLGDREGGGEAWAVFRRASGEAGDDLALRARIEQNLGYAWLFRGDLDGIGTARSRSAAVGRGAAGTTGDGRGVPGVSLRRVSSSDAGSIRDASIAGSPWKGTWRGEFKSHVLRASFVRGPAPQVQPIGSTRPAGRSPSSWVMPRRTA